MITFKEYLLEKALNRSVYMDVIKKLGDTARIGLEIEARVPPESEVYTRGQVLAGKSEQISTYRSLGEFSTMFSISKNTTRQIADDYASWLNAHEDEWVDLNWQEYVDDDESSTAEKQARKAAGRAYKSDHSWHDWMRVEFSDSYGFIENYNLVPTHGWAEQDGNDSWVNAEPAREMHENADWEPTATAIAGMISKLIGADVIVKDAPGPGYDTWKIVPDTSITNGTLGTGRTDDDLSGVGIELVSPPLPVQAALTAMAQIFEFMTQYGLDTNTSTGIHINISVPDLTTKLDPLKLVLFMGDEHVLKQFDRTANHFSRSQIQHIIDGIQITGKVPSTGDELLLAAQQSLSTSKYRSVNLGHIQDGYLEFRAAGGKDYHKRLELITDTVGRWLTAVDLATDPAVDRQEYLKKVAKLLGRTHAAADKDTRSDLSLEKLVISITAGKYNGREIWQDITASTGAGAVEPFKRMAMNFGKELTFEPNIKQVSELRKLMRDRNVTLNDLYQSASAAELIQVKRFATIFRLAK